MHTKCHIRLPGLLRPEPHPLRHEAGAASDLKRNQSEWTFMRPLEISILQHSLSWRLKLYRERLLVFRGDGGVVVCFVKEPRPQIASFLPAPHHSLQACPVLWGRHRSSRQKWRTCPSASRVGLSVGLPRASGVSREDAVGGAGPVPSRSLLSPREGHALAAADPRRYNNAGLAQTHTPERLTCTIGAFCSKCIQCKNNGMDCPLLK